MGSSVCSFNYFRLHHINFQYKLSSHKSLFIITASLFSAIALLFFYHLRIYCLLLKPICSQCTLSLPPVNIRKLQGFPVFSGCRERVHWEQMGQLFFMNEICLNVFSPWQCQADTLREKCPNAEFFLVHVFPISD